MIIYKVRNKEINCCAKNVKYDLVYNNLYEALIYGKYKWILLSSVIDFIQTTVIQQFSMYCRINMWIFDILFISIFSLILSACSTSTEDVSEVTSEPEANSSVNEPLVEDTIVRV